MTVKKSHKRQTPADKVSRYKWKSKNQPGVLCMVSKHELSVNHDYQRPEQSHKATEIARDFDWMSFGVLLVAIRDKDMFVYDGQTRLAAALKREDITEVPCALFEVESTEEEAKGFLGSNVNRKAVKALDKFKAQIMVNHPAACAVKKLCDDHGIRILDGGGAGTTKCVRVMMDLWVPFPQIMEKLFPLFALLARDHALLERVISPLMYIESRLVKQDVTLTKNPWMNRVLRLRGHGHRQGRWRSRCLSRPRWSGDMGRGGLEGPQSRHAPAHRDQAARER
jgi:hypothetical protein